MSDRFATRLLTWFDAHGRHDLPWQHPRTPYRVWLSEIMLQQTQVSVVIPYFQRFVAALPDLPALAAAPRDQVLALWSGLGYYARARNLHTAAQRCVELHDGDLPHDFDALLALPGIGRSTAGAILAQAWDDRFAILDGNVKRLFARFHGIEGWPGTPIIEKQLWELANAHLPHSRLADFTQAQMDLGATLCTRANPDCTRCPLHEDCVAFASDRTATLPTRRPGKTKPERETHVVWMEDRDGRILLQRRPPTGVWASLWALPQFDTSADRDDWLASQGCIASSTELDAIEHVFTHFRLHIHPLRARLSTARMRVSDNDDQRWATRDDLATLGIPAPIRRLLESTP
ncbi:mutY: A/G-specific adenine glycosylase [Lysobacter silvestris]|uniref:Adenine DNA glycosylase n=1 Tax=Solilutibacter silvestris TaxID=1645665 RepID=A0A2K1PXZ0_9GAMM|nr:mutY: A/G-specific adenine glycosylase [Lysobacter silvestris]